MQNQAPRQQLTLLYSGQQKLTLYTVPANRYIYIKKSKIFTGCFYSLPYQQIETVVEVIWRKKGKGTNNDDNDNDAGQGETSMPSQCFRAPRA